MTRDANTIRTKRTKERANKQLKAKLSLPKYVMEKLVNLNQIL